jgi:NADH-quinone oxidoreductase subunit A
MARAVGHRSAIAADTNASVSFAFEIVAASPIGRILTDRNAPRYSVFAGLDAIDIRVGPGNKALLSKGPCSSTPGSISPMSEYLPVGITFLLAGVIVGVMTSLNRLLGPKPRRSAVKEETFECGNPSTGSAWHRFSIKFYLVAILFIIFDVEAVFLYPWGALFRELGWFGFIEMTTFVGVLAVGLAYVWKKGALEW